MVYSDKIHKSRSKKSKVVADEMTSFNYTYYLLVLITAITIALLHRNHISGMFESDRHFSHLSTLERELTFRTEMGLYYSYFKTIVEAPTFWNGLGQIMYDNVTEYPLVINTLKRFNLYPEVLLGAAYRTYDQVMSMLGKQTKICFKVNRGENLSPVQSCEGLGEKPYFYAESVFLLNGLNMGTFFIFGLFLSGTYFGGLLCVLCFFYNHGECTRVQWAPPLRENFAYPFLVLQMLIVTYTIRSKTPSRKHVASIAISSICFMLPWQFAQFALLTQTLSIFAAYLLGFIASKTVQVVAGGQLIGLVMSSILLFGNEMLVTSFFSASLVAIWVVLWMETRLKRLNLPRIFISIVQGISLIILTVVVKITISKLLNITDDEHIGDILRGKFTSFKNFHTLLYVCAPEFDFLEFATPVRLTKTLLLPSSLFVVAAIFVQVILPQLRNLFIPSSSSSSSSSSLATTGASPKQNGHQGHGDSKNGVGKHHSNKEPIGMEDKDTSCTGHGELVYHFFQLAAFSVMAIIIMRLKLFWTPHLCLISSLLASHKFFSWVGSQSRHTAILVCLVAIMSFQGVSNLRSQWGIQGEFSNIQLEQLVDWINDNTPKDGVFAGPMPLMATIKLCTGRPIVNHPHYEDAGLRERTKKVYLMFSRREIPYVWSVYKEMGIQYLIVEEHWCLRRPKPGCGMTDLWDMEDGHVVEGDAVCKKLYNDPGPHFKLLFKNEVYHIFRLLDHQD